MMGLAPARAALEDGEEAKKAAAPSLKSVWKVDAPEGTQRVVVAAVMADETPRVLVLDGAGTLTVNKLSGTTLEKEASVALGNGAGRFVAGRFQKGKPAVIVAPTAVFYREGDTFQKKAITELTDPMASVRFKDGSECLMVFGQPGPPTSYNVDVSAENPLTTGPELPEPRATGSNYQSIAPNLPREIFAGEDAPFPAEVKNGGIIRLVTPPNSERLCALLAWHAADQTNIALVDADMLFPQPKRDMTPVWKSPELSGKVLDIAAGTNPRDSKQTGFAVLEESGSEGKGRVIEFFAFECRLSPAYTPRRTPRSGRTRRR
jgi:hypothetical protein